MIDISIESIDFVGKSLFTKLTQMVHFLRVDGTYSTDAIKQTLFTDIVARHTGMNVSLAVMDFGYAINAFATLPDLNRNHPFMRTHEWMSVRESEGGRIMQMAGNKKTKASVNLANGMVGGFYSECPLTITVFLGLMKNTQFSPAEVASIILHELGHLFTYFQYINTVGYGGLISAIAAKEIAGARTKDERIDLIKQSEKLLGIEKPLDIDANVPQSENKMQVVLFRNYLLQMVSATGTSQYDYRNCEQLADQFATKHGAGRDLVTALDKMYTLAGDSSKLGGFAFTVVETCKLLLFCASLLILPLMPFALISLIIAAPGGYKTYDDPEARVRFIRKQLLASIQDVKKNKNPDSAVLDGLIADIEVVDEVLLTIKDRSTLVQLFWRSLPGSQSRNLQQQEKAAAELEGLMFNNLVYQSVRFEQLTK